MTSFDPTGNALELVSNERIRQQQLKRAGKFKYTCADAELTDFEKLAVLTEEVGEVARELNEMLVTVRERGEAAFDWRLREELSQVAAVAVAWMESNEARMK